MYIKLLFMSSLQKDFIRSSHVASPKLPDKLRRNVFLGVLPILNLLVEFNFISCVICTM